MRLMVSSRSLINVAGLLELGDGADRIAADQGVRVLQGLGQPLGRGGIGIAGVAQFEHGLAADLRLGVVQVRDPRFHLPAAREDRTAFLLAATRQADDRREHRQHDPPSRSPSASLSGSSSFGLVLNTSRS